MKKQFVMIASLAALLLSAPAYASFFSGSGNPSGTPVQAEANFSFGSDLSGNWLDVQLNNTTEGIFNAAGVLTGLTFTTNNDLNVTGLTYRNPDLSLATTLGGYRCSGNPISCLATTETVSTFGTAGWGAIETGTNSYRMSPGGGTNLKPYGIANDSVTSSSPNASLGAADHSPMLASPVIFRLSLSNASIDNLTIQTATFLFGTGTDTVRGTSTVPEPGFYGVLFGGLSGLLFFVRRRKSA